MSAEGTPPDLVDPDDFIAAAARRRHSRRELGMMSPRWDLGVPIVVAFALGCMCAIVLPKHAALVVSMVGSAAIGFLYSRIMRRGRAR